MAPTQANAVSRSTSDRGCRIPDYELLRAIAAGAYGEVWLALNAVGTLRAVKIVRRDQHTSAESFEREFKGLQKFEPVSRTHQGFVDILTLGLLPDEAGFYYVMELADPTNAERRVEGAECAATVDPIGEVKLLPSEHAPDERDGQLDRSLARAMYIPRTLREEFRARGALSAQEVIALGVKLAEALAHLHAHGLVHRDVKPSNILFIDGEPKLADAGLVADVDDARSLVGTAGYIAPEGPGTPQADLYALGKVLYEAAFGKDRQEFPALPANIASRSDHRELLELNVIFLKACSSDAGKRYKSAREMIVDLQLLAVGKSLKGRSAWRRWRTDVRKTAIAAGVVALAATPWWLRKDSATNSDRTIAIASANEMQGTTNHAAWEALQRASQIASTSTPQGISNAIAECEQAVSLDANFAEAWCALGGCRLSLVEIGWALGLTTIPRAAQEIERSLQLDPFLAMGYLHLAQCRLATDYDFASAEPLFRKAIQLAPNQPRPKGAYAAVLSYYGRFDEAEVLLKELIRHYPKLPVYHEILGETYGFARRFAEGVQQHEAALHLEPNRSIADISFGELLWAMGERDRAAQLWLWRSRLEAFPDDDVRAQERALKSGGPNGLLRQLVNEREEKVARGEFVSAYGTARLLGLAGEKVRALDYLERAVDEHRAFVLTAKVHPAFKDFQNEPRYHMVLKRLRLE